jgi:hypothetical protein
VVEVMEVMKVIKAKVLCGWRYSEEVTGHL